MCAKGEPIKQWLAKLGKERIDDIFNPSLAAQKHKPQGLEQNKEVARMGGHAAKVAREDIEKNLGEAVITKQNRLDYEYEDVIKLDSSKEVKENSKLIIEAPYNSFFLDIYD
mgnify:CR=1 FL=1